MYLTRLKFTFIDNGRVFFFYWMAPYFVMLKFMFIGYDSIYTIFLSKIFLNLSLFIIIYIYIW